MITTRLHGRLGNQMFQYAAARALALRLGTGVAIDARHALSRNEGTLTDIFTLPLSQPDLLPPERSTQKLRYLIWRAFGQSPTLRRERTLGFNPEFQNWSDGSYLHGYWQSERYFVPFAAELRQDFTFPTPSAENAALGAQIAKTLSISLHVRRGDYLTAQGHGICDAAYYNAALSRICDQLDARPTVFVFSDDPDWARDNLPLPVEKQIVALNGPDKGYEDMHLMSRCSHHIIANSSFSWWGAWLNPDPAKIVAAPANWFAKPGLSNPDILPQGWLAITP